MTQHFWLHTLASTRLAQITQSPLTTANSSSVMSSLRRKRATLFLLCRQLPSSPTLSTTLARLLVCTWNAAHNGRAHLNAFYFQSLCKSSHLPSFDDPPLCSTWRRQQRQRAMHRNLQTTCPTWSALAAAPIMGLTPPDNAVAAIALKTCVSCARGKAEAAAATMAKNSNYKRSVALKCCKAVKK